VIVDTNVLLRILDGGTGEHATAARARVQVARETGETLRVFAATVLEVAFVLESARAGYGWSRDAVAAAVRAVADEPAFDVEHGDALRFAVASYRDRKVDLHDCYLDALANQLGTRVLSFDDDLRKLGSGEQP
jgi:predicted nucleic-acid-binding protein